MCLSRKGYRFYEGNSKESNIIFSNCYVGINSSTFIIISRAIDKIENLIDENKINGNYEMNLEKYVNYELNDLENTNGVLL